MRNLLCILILLLCLALHGASAVPMWDANQDGGLTAGYRVYSGLASRTNYVLALEWFTDGTKLQ